jgi:tight adherence protein B
VQWSEEFQQQEKEKRSALTEQVDKVVSRTKFGERWRVQLARADLKLTVGEYLAFHIITTLGLGLLTFFVLAPQQPIQTLIAAGIGFFIPRIYVGMKQARRLKAFEQQLPDTLSLWVNSQRAGYSVMQALEAISREAPQPSAGEIKRVVQEVQIGIPMAQAFDHLLSRMPSEDLDLCITAVNINREVGGNLADVLETIAHTIRERIKIKGEIRVLTAQGRLTGYLISGLPIALGIILTLINPVYMGNLFNHRGCGWPMIAVSLGMIGIGMSVIQRIVDIEI